MHPEAYLNCQAFVENHVRPQYGDRPAEVLDIGAQAIGEMPNCLRPLFPSPWRYRGLDLEPGPNIDIVAKPYKFPLEAKTIDVVVSSSCFEHVAHFWRLFVEMVRVTDVGGLIWIDAPSAGPVHWGADYWRFLPGCWSALAEWDQRVVLVESRLGGSETWRDNVGIFKRVKP